MSSLIVDSHSELRELGPGPTALRIAAKVISYVFHPIFIPVYIAAFLITIQPVLFASFTIQEKVLTIVRFFVMYSFFPLVTVLLCKALGFLDSIYLKTQKERIVPYIASMVYYFWMWYVIRNQPQFPDSVVILTFSIFLASIVGLMANIYIKISMHAIAIGIMITFIVSLGLTQPVRYGLYISIALIIAGLVCTSRFIISDHRPKEIYGGLLAGILSQVAAEMAKGIFY